MKVLKTIFNQQLRKQVEIDKMHTGFMPGKNTIHVLFSVKQIIKK